MACSQDIDECRIKNNKVEQAVCTIKTNIVMILSVRDKREREHYAKVFGKV